MDKIKIYLVDDHALFREGLRYLLCKWSFVEAIFEAENGLQFLEGLGENMPDVVLMDIEMSPVSGVEATQRALEVLPGLKVIALSMYSDESYYSSMIDAGASGFLLKNSSFDEVKRAVVDVCEGRTYFSAEILRSIVTLMGERRKDEITERELEVLTLICRGYSNVQIAEELCISKRTVDKHRENLLQKTQSNNTASLVVYAVKSGLVGV